MNRSLQYSLNSISAIAQKSFLNAMVFRSNYLLGIAIEVIFILLSIQLWTVLISDHPVSGVSTMQIVSYMTLVRIVAPVDMDFMFHVQGRVLSGEIVCDIIKPLKYSTNLFAQELGRFANRLLIQSLPIYIAITLFFGVAYPKDGIQWLCFIISIAFSFIIMFHINYITALAAFWITQLFSLNVVKGQTVRFLSGMFVPLWFFPASVVHVIELLPFASVIYVPVQIYMGSFDAMQMLLYLGVQAFWVLATKGIAELIWKKAETIISVNGG